MQRIGLYYFQHTLSNIPLTLLSAWNLFVSHVKIQIFDHKNVELDLFRVKSLCVKHPG